MKHAADYLRRPIPRRTPWGLYARRALDVLAVLMLAAAAYVAAVFAACL